MTADMASRLEIEDLAARYNLAIDLGDPAGWVSCFLPESVSYMNVYYLDAPPDTRLITGVMRDRLARTGASWRFASRRITFD